MPFDTSQEYYLKQLKTSSGFILIQLGLTFFKAKPGTDTVTLKSYNIFVYPQARHATFSCEGASLSFLANNGFDFNKLFKNGISFCRKEEEEKFRKEVADKQAQRLEQLKQRTSTEEQDISNRNFIPVPEREVELINSAREKIQNVVDEKVLEATFDSKLNGFQRKLIYELIEREFNNKVSTSNRAVENSHLKTLVVESKRSAEAEMKIEMNRQKEDEVYLSSVIGLRLLLKELSASKKLIVGHNCLLDLMYLISQCFESLPADYNQFKALTHSIFPNVIDTKFIGSSEKFRDLFPSTVLNLLHERLTQAPFEPVEYTFENPYCTYSFDSPKEHEAGYDSFLTGYCLLVILKHLKVSLIDFVPTKCKELIPYLNRIALVRIHHTGAFIYLTGNEPLVTRCHVFFVKFPATWQSSDLQDHFKNFGPVHIAWVDSATAFVSLINKENSSCVLKTISRPAGFEIKSFAEYQAAENERKRDLSRKRKMEDSESSECSTSANGSKKEPKKKRKAKKAFADNDEW